MRYNPLGRTGLFVSKPAECPGWMFAVQGQYRRDQVNQPARGDDR